MYVPDHFKEKDRNKLHQYIRDYSFGLLVVADDGGIDANHLPSPLLSFFCGDGFPSPLLTCPQLSFAIFLRYAAQNYR
ncbi:FMN-binding negative transcriptional regulator [uncultured Porticoccus sp.]|uniref:FMN-binding negative transcriptional regulator n=1 Tax=uncultured Porticoccus sp. TaxID=1256050 RepID=UPI0030D7D802|tara:strand:+ start:3960 stop:4193 length:234 start_codon:yes stop_codon:yes gene_type:complete